jgi:hypothetical protein
MLLEKLMMTRLASLTIGLAVVPSALASQAPLRKQIDSLHLAMVAAFTADPASTAKFYAEAPRSSAAERG